MACCQGVCRCYSPCCAAPCEPAVPFCSRPPSPMRIQYVGEPKLCSILCTQGVDEPFKPNCKKYHYQGFNRFTDKLGYPVGVLRSLVASSDKALFFDDNEMNGQRYAMCLKAFALLHLIPVNEWERPVLDTLMHEGAELYSQGPPESANRDNERGDDLYTYGDSVYSKEESGIRRAFKMKGYEFEVELSEKYIPNIEEPIASGDTLTEIVVTSLKRALTLFFRDRKYCLLSATNLYLLIWKVDGMFFVLDFYGRSPAKLELQRDGGFATLLCLRLVDNVYYLISQKSNIGKRESFGLREMRMVMLVDPEGRAQTRAFGAKRSEQFVEVSEHYAYLRSALHLSLRENNPLLSRCGLPIAIAAIMASKIDHPAAWDEKTLDKIICYGFFVCRCCWEFCQNSQTPIDYDSFPNQLQIGQFAVSLTLIPRAYQGTWHCVPLYNNTDLSALIQKCFDNGENHLLIAINQQTYAIWKKNNYYYLFDPYRHRLPGSETRSASLRMFASLPLFLNVLNLTLLQSNPTATFYIHRVVVTEIKVSVTSECLTSAPVQVCPEDIRDAKSINEIICFREDYKRCLADLGQESDDELSDSFDEADLEESEEEEPKGEEEGEGGGMLSGFEGVSEDDDDERLKKPRKGKEKGGKVKGTKERKRKGKGKADDDEGQTKERESRRKEKGQKKEKGKKGSSHDKGRKSKDDEDDEGKKKTKGTGGKAEKGKGHKNDNREKAGTTDSEKEDEARRRKSKTRKSRSSRRESRRRSSRVTSGRKRGSKSTDDDKTISGRGSKGTPRRPSSKGRQSKSRESKGRLSKTRRSKSRESKGRLSKGRMSKSRDGKGKDEPAKDGKGRGGDTGKDDRDRDGGRRGDDKDRDGGRRGDDRDRDGGRKGGDRDGDGGRRGDDRDRDGGRKGGDRDGDGGRRGDRDRDDARRGDRDGDGGRRGDRDGDGGRRGDRDEDGGRRGDRDGDGGRRGDRDGDGGRRGDRDGDGGRRGDRDGDGGRRGDRDGDGGRRGDRDGDGGRRGDRDGDGGRRGDRDGDGGRRGDRDGDGGRRGDRDGDGGRRGDRGKRRGSYDSDRDRGDSDSFSSHDGYESDDSRRKRRGSDEMDYDDEGRRRHRRRDRDDESDEGKPPVKGEVICRPNAYPGYSCIPYNMCVCGSESGTYESICKLLRAGFKCADRVLLMTPWGNFVVFRGCSMYKRTYFLFDGCTCNVERFRHLDLNCGTAGLLCFNNLHRVINYIIDSRSMRKCIKKSRQQIVEEICRKYCK